MTGSRTGLRWLLGSGSVITAHLALAQALMAISQAERPLAPPAPVFVDLVAPPAPEPGATPEPAPERADTGLPPAVLEPPLLPELPSLPPVTDLAEQLVPVVSPRPPARPRRVIGREEPPEVKRAPTPQQAQAKSAPPRQTAKPTAQKPARSSAQSSSGTSGRATKKSVIQASTNAMRKWQSDAGARIARHMRRSRISGRGHQIQVRLTITVAASGGASARLAGSTGDVRVDRALSRQAARMPRLPAPPDGRSHSFILPIRITF